PAHGAEPRHDPHAFEAHLLARPADRLRRKQGDMPREVERAPVAAEEAEVQAVDVGRLPEQRAAWLEQLPGAAERGDGVADVLDHVAHADQIERAWLGNPGPANAPAAL